MKNTEFVKNMKFSCKNPKVLDALIPAPEEFLAVVQQNRNSNNTVYVESDLEKAKKS